MQSDLEHITNRGLDLLGMQIAEGDFLCIQSVLTDIDKLDDKRLFTLYGGISYTFNKDNKTLQAYLKKKSKGLDDTGRALLKDLKSTKEAQMCNVQTITCLHPLMFLRVLVELIDYGIPITPILYKLNDQLAHCAQSLVNYVILHRMSLGVSDMDITNEKKFLHNANYMRSHCLVGPASKSLYDHNTENEIDVNDYFDPGLCLNSNFYNENDKPIKREFKEKDSETYRKSLVDLLNTIIVQKRLDINLKSDLNLIKDLISKKNNVAIKSGLKKLLSFIESNPSYFIPETYSLITQYYDFLNKPLSERKEASGIDIINPIVSGLIKQTAAGKAIDIGFQMANMKKHNWFTKK